MTGDARLVAASWGSTARDDLEDRFPGRWDPKRALHADLRPLVAAVQEALGSAGWSEAEAGLVVAVDHHGWAPGLRFGRALAGAGRARPSDFLHSLPSTPAGSLGILFGLSAYQATVHQGAGSGVAALAHACDLLAAHRLERVVVAALSAVDREVAAAVGGEPTPFRFAAALCLAGRGGGPQVEAAVGAPGAEPWPDRPGEDLASLAPGDLSGTIPSGYRVLAAPSLAAVARVAGELGPSDPERVLRHRDPWFGDAGAVRLKRGS